MPRDSASSSSSVTFKKPRRWTREQLTKTLQMLGPTPAPLPPQLPPSPPPSRSSSPSPGSKRKLGVNGETDNAKRPRVGTAADHTHSHNRTASTELSQHHRVTPDSAPSSVSVPGPSADGGASTPVLSSFPNIPPPSAVPIRRPRRGKMSPAEYENIHTKYHNAGRLLKYSGDARFWSTYPPSHREYKPLVNPPPPNSNYHKHGGIIARLELIDALVCFTYAMWAKDSSRRQCFFDNWKTIEGFLSWCKSKWKAEEQHTEAELAFLGLIWMIESFIETRKAFFAARMLSTKMNNVLEKCTDAAVAVCDKFEAETGSKRPVGPQGTPPMLPSPASIGPSPSSHSTPNSCNDGTPNINGRSAQPRAPQPNHPRPLPSPMMEAVQKKRDGKSIPTEAYPALEKVSCSLEPRFMQEISQFTSHVMNAGFGMNTGQALLNLGVMSRAFPNTFARMIHTTLAHGDESEPDIEDEEGELFWPGQCITGEGLGWVCLMGRAMVYEFGKAYGYQGLKAAVPKPTDPSHPPTSVR